MVPLELVGVRVEVPANTPMVLLREQTGRQRLLPIYIGTPEATSIHYALEGVTPPRPLTHDLFVQTLAELGVSLQQIVVTEMRDHTYYAELHLKRAEGPVTVMSSRPSDAIALAVRCHAPLFASEELLDAVGQEPTPEPEEEAEEIIDEFRDFIEHVNPEDFAP
ncbi:MAG: bifunctional nuclease family protein [Ilumatobacteraceae bacterium]